MLIEHKEEDIECILEEKLNHILSFSDFSKTEAINLKKNEPHFFKMQSISILAICSPRHLCLLLQYK